MERPTCQAEERRRRKEEEKKRNRRRKRKSRKIYSKLKMPNIIRI